MRFRLRLSQALNVKRKNYLGSVNLIFLWKTQKLPFFQTPCKVRMDVLVQFSLKPITITSWGTGIRTCMVEKVSHFTN